MKDGHTSVVIEADGGSRGNPGDAAYGAVLKDATTGETIAERAECIGIATNNVAEYRGLIAGLELYNEHTPEADLEVRMDSKLVVEQMSGRWKIKHPDMVPLAAEARRLAPAGCPVGWRAGTRRRYRGTQVLRLGALGVIMTAPCVRERWGPPCRFARR